MTLPLCSHAILTNREPCVSKESVVQAGGGVIYATPSNLYFIGPSGGQSLTDEFFSDGSSFVNLTT